MTDVLRGRGVRYLALALGLLMTGTSSVALAGRLRVKVTDSSTGKLLPVRVYLQSEDGTDWFVESDWPEGSALPYREAWVPLEGSVEKHTTVSAHPFSVELPPGTYQLTVYHGKEYLAESRTIEMGDSLVLVNIPMSRWSHVARNGWYSGETHVHRRLVELPNVMLAEDLNVAFPVTFWTTRSDQAPNLEPSTLRRQGPSPFGDRVDKGSQPIQVDPTHVIFPRNTEYEIFSVGDRRHVLGALFILNHQEVFEQTAPPIRPIAESAHDQEALLDLDKHSWPWSLMLVPVAGVDLFELSNNSVWKTEFGFRQTQVGPADYMEIEVDERGMSEEGWLRFGFEFYYGLLNCGFRLQPTAGTASGVHPVPLGFSRVYVHLDGEFEPQAWIKGLKEGRSFVTTGPMLLATVNGQHPGEVWQQEAATGVYHLEANCELPGDQKLERIEVLVNGEVVKTQEPSRALQDAVNPTTSRLLSSGSMLQADVTITEPSWIAVRCFSRTKEGRIRFAHTAPWHVEIPGQQILPRREQIDYFVNQMQKELKRNEEVLDPPALAEFRSALETYEAIQTKVLEKLESVDRE